jgi:hypothetical protein
MPKTNADYQREHRQRQAHRLAELQAENASLHEELSTARTELDAALAECGRLAAMACKRPAAVVDPGTCWACGAELWRARYPYYIWCMINSG